MTVSERDYRALAARLLRPERPRKTEALAVVGGCTDPAVAWEALASTGMIPEAWTAGGTHGYATGCTDCAGGSAARVMLCEACGGWGRVVLAHPPTVLACVALAAGAQGARGAVAAEAMARAAVDALTPWGCPQPTRLVWQVGEGNGPGPEVLGVGCVLTALAAAGVLSPSETEDAGDHAARAVLGEAGFEGVTRLHQLANYCYAAALWRAACSAGATVTVTEPPYVDLVSPRVLGRLYTDLPDPFESLLGVWSLGYALDDATAVDLLLMAPEGKD